METATGRMRQTVPGVHESLFFVLTLLIVTVTFGFAFWTIACHICVLGQVPFRVLAVIGPFVFATGLFCGVLYSRVARRLPTLERTTQQDEPVRPAWIAVIIAAVLVVLYRLGLGYSAFWIGCLLLLLWGVFSQSGSRSGFWQEPVIASRPERAALFFVILTAPILTYVAHRPDVDDAAYVGTAADAVANPELPVLSHDAIYGDQKLPVMLPSYAVEAYELFIAMLAHLFGGAPILWAHAIVPTVIAAFVPIAWAMLMRILAPRHWVLATVLALVALSLPADFRGFGNFAFVRLFQGKAVLVSVGIPLLYSAAWKFQESGAVWDWCFLFAATITCVGLSASAIFVVPLALGAASFAGWSKGASKRVAITLLASIYPLACGLAVSHSFRGLEGVFAKLPARAHFALVSVLGAHEQYLFLFALLAAPFLERQRRLCWLLSILVLFYLLVPMNPFTFKFLSKFTTRDAVWRVLWCVPVAGMVASACLNGVKSLHEQWGRRGLLAGVVALACGIAYLAPHSSFAPSNGAVYSLKPLKVTQPEYEVAKSAISATPSNTSLLAPEDVAVWIPTFVRRVPLVSVREVYDAEMGAHLSREDAQARRSLRELISDPLFDEHSAGRLLNQLPEYNVGLIVTSSSAGRRLAPLLAERKFSLVAQKDGYYFFALSGEKTSRE